MTFLVSASKDEINPQSRAGPIILDILIRNSVLISLMLFPVLRLIKPQDIIHQLKDKSSKKLFVALVLRFGVVLAQNLGFPIG